MTFCVSVPRAELQDALKGVKPDALPRTPAVCYAEEVGVGYARSKLSRTRRSSLGSLARICSTVGSGLDPCRTSATRLALPFSMESRLA